MIPFRLPFTQTEMTCLKAEGSRFFLPGSVPEKPGYLLVEETLIQVDVGLGGFWDPFQFYGSMTLILLMLISLCH